MKIEVSIIIPAYNAEKYIKRCINSIKKQTYMKFEALIVNDGSTDNTKKVIESNISDDARFILIDKKNAGVSAARNDALAKARGKYVMFVDSDDWLEKNMIELMLKKAEHDDLDIVFCAFNEYYENDKRTSKIMLNDNGISNCLSLISTNSTNFGGYPWNKLIKKDIINKPYRTDIHYYENLIFFLDNLKEDTKWGYINTPLYNYSINDTSALHSKKYNIKKLTSLDALKYAINLLPIDTKDFHKMLYITSFYENKYQLNKNNYDKKILNQYRDNIKKYYYDVLNSNYISLKLKIKVFVLHRLNFIYVFVKNIKNKKEGTNEN